jgi:hypothetical protein
MNATIGTHCIADDGHCMAEPGCSVCRRDRERGAVAKYEAEGARLLGLARAAEKRGDTMAAERHMRAYVDRSPPYV